MVIEILIVVETYYGRGPFFIMNLWWLQVSVNPEANKTIVLTTGTLIELIIFIPMGG